jgi:DNA-binding XRE family transcriptional regulator
LFFTSLTVFRVDFSLTARFSQAQNAHMEKNELKALRGLCGWNQTEMAQKMGIPRWTYSRIELGQRALKAQECARLRRLFTELRTRFAGQTENLKPVPAEDSQR